MGERTLQIEDLQAKVDELQAALNEAVQQLQVLVNENIELGAEVYTQGRQLVARTWAAVVAAGGAVSAIAFNVWQAIVG